jgi:putative RecB family exonuclease
MRLSHSQAKSLLGCDLSWWIQRRARMPGTTYWSTLAGSVFHERVETYLLTGSWPEESITDHLDRLIADHLKGTPFTAEDGIRISKAIPPGLKAADYPNGFDREAAIPAIQLWIDRWLEWMKARKAEGWELWYAPDGTPGVEVEVRYELGDHPVIGSIDCVLTNRNTGEIWLVDWKAGRSKPDDSSQLDGYRIGFEERFGLKADLASFYMARNAQDHLKASMPTFTREMLDHKFRQAGERAAEAEAGRFDPDLSQCAYLCPVAQWCPVKDPAMDWVVAGVGATW